jgi:Spy/CpxP family protein refolding chaperone
MNKPWKVILVLIGIFIAGGVTGGFVTQHIGRLKLLNRPVPEEWAPRHLKRLVDRLDLTKEQQEQIRPIVRRNMEQLGRLRNHAMTETLLVVEAMQRDIAERLTPEQRTKFERMNRELRDMRESRDKIEREKRKNLDHSSGDKPTGDGPAGEKPPAPLPPGT